MFRRCHDCGRLDDLMDVRFVIGQLTIGILVGNLLVSMCNDCYSGRIQRQAEYMPEKG